MQPLILPSSHAIGSIWTHLIGTALFAIRLYNFTVNVKHYSPASAADILAVSVYYIGCMNCFFLSTVYHVFSNHSKEMHDFVQQLDHLGIVLVIYGSGVPVTYFQFYCDHFMRNTYWIASTSFALASAMFTLQPRFREPKFREARFYMFSVLGLSCFFPILHGVVQSGYQSLDQKMALSHFIRLAMMNFLGSLIYAVRVPERLSPKTFDIIGYSHQIMHTMVVLGALIYEKGLLESLQRWNDGRNSCFT